MTTSVQKPSANKSQPQRVVENIQRRILNGELKPGERIPTEPVLMHEFSVSRTVVREAMSSLQASGYVKTRHGSGTFVLERLAPNALLSTSQYNLNSTQIMALLEMLISLGAEAAHLAANRRTEEQLASMRESLQNRRFTYQKENDGEELDFRFHTEIAAATQNPYFVEVIGNLLSTLIRTDLGATLNNRGPEPAEDSFGKVRLSLPDVGFNVRLEHETIFDAITRKDAASAKAAMFIHLNNFAVRHQEKFVSA